MSTKEQAVSPLRMTAVMLALLLSVAACGGGSAGGGDHAGGHEAAESIHEPVEGADEATLTAVDLDFEPTTLELTAGEPLNLTIVNDGEALHDFTLEEAEVHVNVEPGTSKTTSLTIEEPGIYEALCTVAGHAEAGMTVEVVVS